MERIKMPMQTGVVFTPTSLSAIGKALTDTAEILGIGSDKAKRQAVAKFIIRLAIEDAKLDAASLRDRAVVALGGAAYRDMAAGAERAISS
jgi:hypothetical protein